MRTRPLSVDPQGELRRAGLGLLARLQPPHRAPGSEALELAHESERGRQGPWPSRPTLSHGSRTRHQLARQLDSTPTPPQGFTDAFVRQHRSSLRRTAGRVCSFCAGSLQRSGGSGRMGKPSLGLTLAPSCSGAARTRQRQAPRRLGVTVEGRPSKCWISGPSVRRAVQAASRRRLFEPHCPGGTAAILFLSLPLSACLSWGAKDTGEVGGGSCGSVRTPSPSPANPLYLRCSSRIDRPRPRSKSRVPAQLAPASAGCFGFLHHDPQPPPEAMCVRFGLLTRCAGFAASR